MIAHSIKGGGGVTLRADEAGNPKGRPILFLHGATASRLVWDPQMTSTLANDFRLVAVDLRGHGESEKPEGGYGDAHLWADDVRAVIDTLKLDRPVLVGHSYGALVICDYLRAHGDGGIAGFQLVGALTKVGSDAAFAVFSDEMKSKIAPGLLSAELNDILPATELFLRISTAQPLPLHRYYMALGYGLTVPGYVRLGLFDRQVDNDDVLRAVNKPALITHGHDDNLILLAAAEHHAAVIRHARKSYYPNVRHFPSVENPDRFNAELGAFVKEC
jgi:pimeloyl-ACP methyl ester carboxylesterase